MAPGPISACPADGAQPGHGKGNGGAIWPAEALLLKGWLRAAKLFLLQQRGSAVSAKDGRSGGEVFCVLLKQAFLQNENKSQPKVTRKDGHPLQGPPNAFFCNDLQFHYVTANQGSLWVCLILSIWWWPQAWTNNYRGSMGTWENYSESSHFPQLSSPTSSLLPKVCSPVRCQVDDSNSQMCHAQLVNNRLSNRAINLLARWVLCRAAMP